MYLGRMYGEPVTRALLLGTSVVVVHYQQMSGSAEDPISYTRIDINREHVILL